MAAECATAGEITARLEQLVFSWKERHQEAGATADDVAGQLSSATADEIISFIDSEFGLS